MNLANFQANLESNGQIDLSKHGEISYDEFDVFAKTILSLNRKKYPLKNLILDNCDLTDDKLEALAPLMVKFQHVTLNGSQKIQSSGYFKLGRAIREPGCKMTKLELKISKNDDATIRLRREILLEELKGMKLFKLMYSYYLGINTQNFQSSSQVWGFSSKQISSNFHF